MPARKARAKVPEEPEIHEEEVHEASTGHPECFCMGMGPQVSAAVKMGSEKTREDFRTARIEFLKGLRNLLDERIESLSKETPAQKGAKISVD
jgi:hypothetical protein